MACYESTAGRSVSLSCIVCGDGFVYITKSKGRYRRTCSEECRSKRNARALSDVPCKTCARKFKPRRGGQTYCSLPCRPQSATLEPATLRQHKRDYAKRYQARKRGVLIERFTSLEVYERDGWMCGICGRPVDKTLRHPHHMAASIDHVLPLACGGAHTRANVQCAHWICNSRKTDLRGQTKTTLVRDARGPLISRVRERRGGGHQKSSASGVANQPPPAPKSEEPKPAEKLGKKEQASRDAQTADEGTSWANLLKH